MSCVKATSVFFLTRNEYPQHRRVSLPSFGNFPKRSTHLDVKQQKYPFHCTTQKYHPCSCVMQPLKTVNQHFMKYILKGQFSSGQGCITWKLSNDLDLSIWGLCCKEKLRYASAALLCHGAKSRKTSASQTPLIQIKVA